jgi:predicted PurR-regulated permease PerM
VKVAIEKPPQVERRPAQELGTVLGICSSMAERARPLSVSVVGLWILVVLGTLFFLRTARELLIPIALAVLISYALEPVVAWLQRHHIPRIAGAGVVMLLILGAAGWGVYALRDDAGQLIEAAPKAAQKAREMVLSQVGSGGAVQQQTKESKAAADSRGPESGDPAAAQGASGEGAFAQRAAGVVFSLAGHMVVIFFLIFFLLISGHHVRDRLVEISGPNPERRRLVSTIVSDINAQIQRFLLVLLFTAVVVALATWVVLAWMGVRHAATWAILAGVFNSIPYFGPVIVSGGLFVVGLVQGGGAAQGLQMAGAALVITSLEGWLLTPPLMGKAERMGALVVFLGLLVWTWLWGGGGTILAVPMLVVIKSVADHVDRLKPVGRLMAP